MHRRDYLLSSIIFGFGSMQVISISLMMPELAKAVTEKEELDIIDPSQEQQQRMAFNRRPTAPAKALIPAIQQRLLLVKCLALSEELILLFGTTSKSSDVSSSSQRDTTILMTTTTIIEQLKSILVDPKTRGDNFNYYTPNLTYKKRTERDQKVLLEYYTKSDRTKLSGEVVLAAMNIYTDNLKYSKEYNVQDNVWKKDYIRSNDGLPNVEKLVRADMDLRVMYRNQVQLKVDDAAAELYSATEIQPNNNGNSVLEFAMELQQLLKSANFSFEQWIAMIDDADIKEATHAITEGKYYY